MIEGRNCPRFTVEPGRELCLRSLQSNVAVKPGVARLPDLSHAALAQLRKKLVSVAELVAWLQFHLVPMRADGRSEQGTEWIRQRVTGIAEVIRILAVCNTQAVEVGPTERESRLGETTMRSRIPAELPEIGQRVRRVSP